MSDEVPGVQLVEEVMKKAAVVWVAVGDRPSVALWCLPFENALYVVSGPGEQSAPDLDDTTTATVTMRGDHGGRIVTWTADVTRVAPDDDQWAMIAPLVAAKRLNAPGSATELADRWAAECVIHRLAPAGTPAVTGRALPDGSLAAPPRETTAVRRTRKPFRLHRVRRR